MRSLLLLLLFVIGTVEAKTQSFESSIYQTQLIELYTSQGCSSCPPAEKWLSQFLNKDSLWKKMVPINFHVDYQDNLGWPDRYASSRFTDRQRTYKALGNTRTVATPGFVINGHGWNGWFYGQNIPLLPLKKIGKLSLTIDDRKFTANYLPTDKKKNLMLNIVQLGFGIFDRIKRGENAGKLLRHDFVALSFQQVRLVNINNSFQYTGKLENSLTISSRKGVAAWITDDTDPTPIQSVGGFLE